MAPRRRKNNAVKSEQSARSRGVRPALRGLGIVFFLALCALPVPFIADPIAYVPPITYVLALLASYSSLHVAASHLFIDESTIDRNCSRGESVVLDVEICNRSFVPVPRLDLVFIIADKKGSPDVYSNVRASVGARQDLPLSFDATFAHLGMYECGIDHVVLYDFFGIFSKRVDVMHHDPVAVRPKKFDVGDPDLAHVSKQESMNLFRPIASDDQDYTGVREYRYGDSMKTVHWNLSGRDPQERLYTRLYEVYAEPGLAVIIDPYAPSYELEELRGTFDALIEAAASVSEAARAQGVDATVRYLDSYAQPASVHLASVSDVNNLVETMLPVTCAAGDASSQEAVEMLETEARSNQGRGNVAFCTSRADERVIQALLSMKMRGRNPMLFFSVPRMLPDDERRELTAPLRRLGEAGIPWYVVDSNEVATEVSRR